MSKPVSGGGIQSSVNRKVGVKAGPPNTRVISPRGVSQLGYAAGGKIRPGGGYTGENTSLPVFERKAGEQTLGNELATDVGKGGPGTGRQVYKSGYQAQYGNVVPGNAPGKRSVFAEYPPETSGASLVRKR
jgi:hypothetical protein